MVKTNRLVPWLTAQDSDRLRRKTVWKPDFIEAIDYRLASTAK